MELTFGKALEYHPDAVPLLLCAFGSMIHHTPTLIWQMLKVPGHQFNRLAVLHDKDLLTEMRALVMLESTEGVLMLPIGVPPSC